MGPVEPRAIAVRVRLLSQRVLEEGRDLVNADFLEMIDHVAQDLTGLGRQEDINTLRQIQGQAAEMIG